MRRGALIASLCALLAAGACARPALAQMPEAPCPAKLFSPFVPCDRAGAIVCSAAFGIYRFDGSNPARDAACDVRRSAGAAVLRLLLAKGERDPASPLAVGFKRAIDDMLAHRTDPSVDFWVLAYNTTDQPASVALQAILGLFGSRIAPINLAAAPTPEWDFPGDASYWQPESYLLQQISLGNDGGMQPTKRWREADIALKPGEILAAPIRLLRRANMNADGPRPAGIFPIGLFRETALDHYSIDEPDVLSLGVAAIEASPGWGPVRSHW